MSGYAPEYEIGGVKDPFLQCKILELLGRLGAGNSDASDEMSDVLAQVATNTESTKQPGISVLAECVRTIMAIEASGGLRVLGINILGKFL
jgi:AP-1 complex subunit gamma-1